MNDVTIRDRRPADLPGCVAVLAEVHRHDRYPLNWPSDPVGWLSPPTVLGAWVAEISAGAVVGHVAVHRPAEVSRLFVAPTARGQHVGAELLGHARRWATAHGIGLTLEIVDESRSAPAIALYERTGWRHVDTVTATWRGPDGRPVRLRRYTGSA
jgi:GNAT superfamily N-acetyltransferase